MMKDEINGTLAVIDNYNFCDMQTNRQTGGHGDSMTDPAQMAESVKIKIRKWSKPSNIKGFLVLQLFTLFDQKSPALLVPVANGVDRQTTDDKRTSQLMD